jgi:hypothetical protein
MASYRPPPVTLAGWGAKHVGIRAEGCIALNSAYSSCHIKSSQGTASELGRSDYVLEQLHLWLRDWFCNA